MSNSGFWQSVGQATGLGQTALQQGPAQDTGRPLTPHPTPHVRESETLLDAALFFQERRPQEHLDSSGSGETGVPAPPRSQARPWWDWAQAPTRPT